MVQKLRAHAGRRSERDHELHRWLARPVLGARRAKVLDNPPTRQAQRRQPRDTMEFLDVALVILYPPLLAHLSVMPYRPPKQLWSQIHRRWRHTTLQWLQDATERHGHLLLPHEQSQRELCWIQRHRKNWIDDAGQSRRRTTSSPGSQSSRSKQRRLLRRQSHPAQVVSITRVISLHADDPSNFECSNRKSHSTRAHQSKQVASPVHKQGQRTRSCHRTRQR